jgi:LPXTG-motif cell wall-anchored protein
MKKYFLQAMLMLVSLATFAQEEEHDAAYNFGRKNAVPIIIGVVVVIVLIIWMVMRRKKKTP